MGIKLFFIQGLLLRDRKKHDGSQLAQTLKILTIRARLSPVAGTILIVDDDEPTQRLLDAVMRRNGLTCLTARNGEEAIDIIQRRDDIACIILDLMMPHVDGTAVIAHLSDTRSVIPVIVCSAAVSSRTPPFDPVVRAVLRKPFDIDELSETVTRLVGELGDSTVRR
jgi:CheY-like chemotaxis protein